MVRAVPFISKDMGSNPAEKFLSHLQRHSQLYIGLQILCMSCNAPSSSTTTNLQSWVAKLYNSELNSTPLSMGPWKRRRTEKWLISKTERCSRKKLICYLSIWWAHGLHLERGHVFDWAWFTPISVLVISVQKSCSILVWKTKKTALYKNILRLLLKNI